MNLYRGENYGVFTGPSGYYIARMAADGKSYYEALGGSEGWWPWGGGEGWSDEVRHRCNAQAAELDSMADLPVGVDAET